MADVAQAPVPGLLTSAPRREIVALLDHLPHVATAEEPSTRDRGLTAAQLAERLDRHVTTIRFHLDQLVAGGLVDYHDERAGVGRPSRYYTMGRTVANPPDQVDVYRVTAKLLLDLLASGEEPETVAASWMQRRADTLLPAHIDQEPATSPGQWLAKVGPVVDLMQRWGFDPAISSSNAGHTADMTLCQCPISDLSTTRPGVVCALHMGLITEALRCLGEEDAKVELHPATNGNRCRVSMTTSTRFPAYERAHA
ncbi:MAG TPA: helix-turn-helix domain-containing protein [Propionibacteriaceae bacterium]|nr:helix-turn-helix domain-containing protein [Propionibacteriaceae bacterium]